MTQEDKEQYFAEREAEYNENNVKRDFCKQKYDEATDAGVKLDWHTFKKAFDIGYAFHKTKVQEQILETRQFTQQLAT